MLSTEQKQLQQEINILVNRFDSNRNNLLPILQEFCADHEEITSFDMQVIAKYLHIHPVEVYSLLSFYPSLSKKVKSKYNFQLCQPLSINSVEKDKNSEYLQKALNIDFGESSSDGLFSLGFSDCIGYCDQSPVLMVNDHIFTHVDPAKIDQIVSSCRDGKQFKSDELPESFTGKLSFDNNQAFNGLKAILKQSRDSLVGEMKEESDPADQNTFSETNTFNHAIVNGVDYVICNADAGEPYAYANRSLLTSRLDYVIEGMLISSYLSGANKGLIFLPGRYAYLQSYLEKRMDDYHDKKLLGNSILDKSGFDFEIEVHVGPGSYSGREETILIASLTSRRLEPHEAIETQYDLLIKPASAYAWMAYYRAAQEQLPVDVDNEISASPNLISISGDCEQPGLYEFTGKQTISEILKAVNGENVEAVLLGGISGKFVLPKDFDNTLDSFDLPEIHAAVIYKNRQDILEAAKEILTFYSRESCGQCVPCRNGIPLLLNYIRSITNHKKPRISISEIRTLGETVHLASKCILGQSAPVAFLSILDILSNN